MFIRVRLCIASYAIRNICVNLFLISIFVDINVYDMIHFGHQQRVSPIAQA